MNRRGETTDDPAEICNKPDRQTSNISVYAGDTLWSLAAFLGIGLILRRTSTRTVACLALAFSIAVELSQLYHAPWIDSIRQTNLGGLFLGFGFLWSDLACYAVGVVLLSLFS
jgi:Protein of unknown function (DUF2809)